MSDGAFRVDLSEVEQFVNDLRAFVSRAQDQVDALNKDIDRLHITWRGEAAQAHRDAHQRWVEGMGHLRDGISDIARSADHSHRAYTGVQELHQKMWP
ncbi:WXG100 family type VII secretion target [Williamsia sterculiae]|uniref:ESAT-6-like protein n=1 Tax=Williamsia sterculiae TaxID=1344003 RepID=A0A1N7HAZ3_9NOCA|nr:WXG100 family type VII secretion target [Williamsia sterculiae]SIS22054.1 WXG100 family type VII secretion target [Williamsia sterculiae]